LLDDPAAELDETSLGLLMESVVDLNCQVIATSLVPRKELFDRAPAMFHVEQGVLERVP
jgi:recombinational DNA repair ATPase RecF